MNRSPTENAPQNLPNRSLISRAWPTPVTAPRRTTISWLTTSTGIKQGQRPQQREPEVLPGLAVGGDAAGVVVADHDDEARPHDGQQGEQPGAPRPSGVEVVLADGPEGTLDVAHVGVVEDGGRGIVLGLVVGHGSPPSGSSAVSGDHPDGRARPVEGSGPATIGGLTRRTGLSVRDGGGERGVGGVRRGVRSAWWRRRHGRTAPAGSGRTGTGDRECVRPRRPRAGRTLVGYALRPGRVFALRPSLLLDRRPTEVTSPARREQQLHDVVDGHHTEDLVRARHPARGRRSD